MFFQNIHSFSKNIEYEYTFYLYPFYFACMPKRKWTAISRMSCYPENEGVLSNEQWALSHYSSYRCVLPHHFDYIKGIRLFFLSNPQKELKKPSSAMF